MIVSLKDLPLIQLGASTGGLIFISKDQLNHIINTISEYREAGAPAGKVAMFPDEIIALRKAFEI